MFEVNQQFSIWKNSPNRSCYKLFIDDCDHLASSIAEVFEEAANKVEIDKKETERRYLDKVKQLEGVIAKVRRINLRIGAPDHVLLCLMSVQCIYVRRNNWFSLQMKITQAQISQNYSIVYQKNQLLEAKLKESQETNSKLDSDLQVASLQIVFKITFLVL